MDISQQFVTSFATAGAMRELGWASRPDFSRSSGTTAAMTSRRRARRIGASSSSRCREPDAARAGLALHGLRHPVLSRRLPGQQPDPGLEQSGLPRPVAERADASCTRPTISRNSPAASARRRARRPARSTSTTTRSRSKRSNARSSTAAGTRAGSCRWCRRAAPASGSRWSARARPAWPAPSNWRAPGTR